MKFCKKCSETKSLDNFSKNKRTKDGLAQYCKKCIYSYVSEWQKKHPDRAKKKSATWRNKNREKVNKQQSQWRKDNRDKANAQTAKRKALKLQRTPKWLTNSDWEEIKWAYSLASQLTQETGIPHEVDHIIPLQGENISGLHCPQNLQILNKSQNRKKSNNFS